MKRYNKITLMSISVCLASTLYADSEPAHFYISYDQGYRKQMNTESSEMGGVPVEDLFAPRRMNQRFEVGFDANRAQLGVSYNTHSEMNHEAQMNFRINTDEYYGFKAFGGGFAGYGWEKKVTKTVNPTPVPAFYPVQYNSTSTFHMLEDSNYLSTGYNLGISYNVTRKLKIFVMHEYKKQYHTISWNLVEKTPSVIPGGTTHFTNSVVENSNDVKIGLQYTF